MRASASVAVSTVAGIAKLNAIAKPRRDGAMQYRQVQGRFVPLPLKASAHDINMIAKYVEHARVGDRYS